MESRPLLECAVESLDGVSLTECYVEQSQAVPLQGPRVPWTFINQVDWLVGAGSQDNLHEDKGVDGGPLA
jgi:hypothetical protein